MPRINTILWMVFGALLVLAAGCDTSISKGNPYDPDLPEHQKAPASLAGRVELEVGDPSLASVEVRPAGKNATPDDTGEFLIADLPPGSYTVVVTAPGHSTWTQGGVYCGVGEDVNLGRIGLLAARGAVSGSVVLKLDPDSEADAHGGALVYAFPTLDGRLAAGEAGQSAVTGPGGNWTLTGLPVGTYQLSGSKDGYAPSPPIEVVVTEDETTPVPDLVLRSITGVIRIDEGAPYTNHAGGQVTVTVLAFETDEMQISEDPEFADASWEQHTAERVWSLSEGDGEKTVYMRFRNGDIYETPAVYDTIVLDREPPSLAEVSIAGGKDYVTSAQVALRLYAEDALSGVADMRIAMDGDITDETWDRFVSQRIVELEVSDAPNGETGSVAVQYRDGAGNEGEVVEDAVLVDSVAPQNAALTIEYGATRTASRDVTLTLVAEGAREMQVSNDSGLSDAEWQPYSPSMGWRLTDGDEQKTVYALFRDAALNESEIVQDGIELNTRGSVSGSFLLEGAAADGNADITVSLSTDPPTVTTTSQDGSFALSDVRVGVYSLTASRDGYRPVQLPYLEVLPGEDAALEPALLAALRGGLTGIATRQGAAADGHVGIVVEVVGSGKSTVTNAAGEWTVENLPVAQFTVRATTENYLDATATDVDVVADTITTVPALMLAPNPGSITGSVALEGMADPDLGIAEVLVAGQTVTCGGDGSFEVQNIRAGTYALLARAAGYAAVEKLVTVEPGQPTALDPIALELARGHLLGTAELEGETDHSGILIEVQGTGFSAVTNAAGEWTIRGVPVSQYTIRASREGFVAAVATDVDVSAGVEATVPLMTLPGNPGSISGWVALEGLADPDLDIAEVVVAGQTVPALADGSFTVSDVGAGVYTLLARAPGFASVEVVVTVEPGTDTPVGTLALEVARGHLAGTAEREGATDHSGILVEVQGTSFSALSNALGEWSLRGVPVGQYTVKASATNFNPASETDVDVFADQETTVPLLTLTANPGSVTGFVELEGRLAGSWDGVTVLVEGPGLSDLSDPDGSFEILGVPAGTYPVAATMDGYATEETVVTVEAGQAVNAGVLALSIARGDIEGTATLAGATDHSGITVEIDSESYAGTTNAAGTYRIAGIPVGAYTLTARKDEYVARPVGGVTVLEDQTVTAAAVELVRSLGDFEILERATDETGYINDTAVKLVFSDVPADSLNIWVAEDAAFSDGSWVLFSGSPHNYDLLSSDGPVSVFVKFESTFGAVSSVFTSSTVLDRVPPKDTSSVTIDGGAEFSTDGGGDVNLTLVAEDEHSSVARMRVAVDGAVDGETDEPFNATKTVRVDDPGVDGVKTVLVEFIDLAGNPSVAPASDTIYLDRAGPVNDTIEIDGGAGFASGVLVTLALFAEDVCNAGYPGGGTCAGGVAPPAQMMISNEPGFPGAEWEAYATSRAWFLQPGDATKTVHARFRDAAGNASAAISDDIVLDQTPPGSAQIAVQGGEVTGTQNVNLLLSATGTPTGMNIAEGGNFQDINWEAYDETAQAFTLSAGDGIKTVAAKFRDAAGNESVVVSDTVTLDTLAPNLFGIAVDGGAEYATAVNVTVHVDADGAEQLMFSEAADFGGASWEPYASQKGFVLTTGDGEKTVYAKARDAALNESGTVFDSIELDTADPSGSMMIDGGAQYTMSRTVALQFSGVSVDVTEVMASEDAGFAGGVWLTYQAELSWLLSAVDATKTVYVKFRDAAGNESADVQDDIELDTSPPTSPSISIDEGDNTNDPDINLTLSAVNADEMQLSENPGFSGASWEAYATSRAWSLSAGDGQKIVYVRYRDAAGNESSTASDVIVLDTGEPFGPSISINAGDSHTNDPVVTLYLSAQDAAEMKLSELADLSDASWEAYAVSKTWTFAAGDGTRTVYARFRDAALNETATVSDDIELDTADPTGSVSIDGGAQYATSRSVTLTFSGVSADVVDVMISEDSGFLGAIWQDYAASLPLTLSAGDGAKTVYVKFRDAALNESPDANDGITLDTSAPANPSVVIDLGAAHNNNALHQLSLTVGATGAAQMDIAEVQDFSASTGWIAVTTPYSYALAATADGEKTVYVRYRDAAGNETAVVSDSVVHDVTAPTGGFLQVDNGAVYSTAADGKVDLYVGASDALSGMDKVRIRNSGDSFSDQTYASVISDWILASPTSVDDELRTVEVVFVDRAGNESSPVIPDGIMLDNMAPGGQSLTIVDGDATPGDGYTTELTVDLTLSASGAAEMKLSHGNSCGGGSWQGYAESAVWTLAGDGAGQAVSVRYRDAAGNESGCASDSINVDTQAPQLPGVVIDSGALYNNDDVTHELNLKLAVVGATEVNIGEDPDFLVGTGWIAYDTDYATTGYDYPLVDTDDGEKTIYVQYRDAASNETAVVNDSILHDTTPPAGGYVFLDNDADYTSDVNGEVDVYVGASDTLSGLDQVELSNTGAGGWTAYSYAAVIADWVLATPTGADGEIKTVYVRFVDKAGNTSGSDSDSIILDNVAPSGTMVINSDAAYSDSPSVELDFTADAEVVEAAVSNSALNCDTAAYGVFNDPQAWSLNSTEGTRTVYVCLRDAAGNWVSDDDGIILDTTAPQVPTFLIDGGAAYTNDASRQVDLSYFATDANGVASVEAANEGTFSSPTTLAWDELTNPNVRLDWVLPAGDGTKNVYIRFTDVAGNQAVRQQEIVLDLTAPDGTGITLDPTDYISGDTVRAFLDAVGADKVCLTGDFTDAGGKGPGADCTDLLDPSWQDMVPELQVTLTDGDGSKTVTAYYRDGAGNTDGPVSDDVFRDEAIPTIISLDLTGLAADPTQASTNTRNRTISAVLTGATDPGADASGLSQMRFWEGTPPADCSSPSGTWSEYLATSSYSLSSDDGDKLVCAQVRDAAQNSSSAVMAPIRLDTEEPEVPLEIIGATARGDSDEYSFKRAVKLNVDAVDDTSGPYQMKLSRNSDFSAQSWVAYQANVPSYDLMPPTSPTCRTLVVINEVDLAEPDRVELYNATGMPVQLKDWTLECWVGASPAMPDVVWTLPEAVILPWEYLALDEGAGADTWNYLYLNAACGWGDTTSDPGAAILKNALGQEVDFVRWNGSNTVPTLPQQWSEAAPISCADAVGRTSEAFDRNLAEDWCEQAESIGLVNGDACGLVESDCKENSGYRGVYVKVRDRAGNSTTGFDDIMLDMEPATGWFEIDDGAEYTTDLEVELAITTQDNWSGVAEMGFTEDPTAVLTWAPEAQSFNYFLGPPDGRRLIYMALRDEAGNEDPVLLYAAPITLDRDPPVSPCVLTVTNGFDVLGTRYVGSGFVQMTIATTDPISGVADYQAAEDQNFTTVPWLDYAGQAQATLGAGDGTRTVYARVRDHAGNEQGVFCGSVQVYQDTQAPSISVNALTGTWSAGRYYISENRIRIDVDCQDAFCEEIYVEGDVVNGGDIPVDDWYDFATYNLGYVNLTAGDGSKNMAVSVRDRARNVSAPAIVPMHVDSGLPVKGTVTLNGLSPDPTNYTRERSVTVDLSGWTDADSDVYQMMISEDSGFAGAEWEEYRDHFAWTLSSGDGVKRVYVKTRDLAGNETAAPPVFGPIELDTQPPIVNLDISGTGAEGPDMAYTRDREVDLTINANDLGGSGEEKMELSRDGSFSGAWVDFASPVNGYDLVDPATATCRKNGVRITEVNTGTPDFVELVNATGYPVDLTGWQIVSGWSTGSVTYTLPDYQFGPGEFVAVDDTVGAHTEHRLHLGGQGNINWGGTSAGFVILRDAEGNALDFVRFNNSNQTPPAGTGWTQDIASIATLNGVAGRNNLGLDRDLASDWCNQGGVASAEVANPSNCSLTEGDCSDSQGSRPVYVQVRDHAGNIGNASSSITLDVEAPSGDIRINDSDRFTGDPLVNLSMSYNDDVSGTFQMKLGEAEDTYGSWQDPVDNLVFNLTQADGKAKTYVRYRDRAGNLSPSFADDIVLDTAGPSTCTVEFNDLTTPTNASLKQLDINYADATSEVIEIMLSEDGGFAGAAWQPAVMVQDWVLSTGDGNKQVRIRCKDEAENVTEGLPTTQIRLDTTPPSASYMYIDDDAEYVNHSSGWVDLTYGYDGDAFRAIASNYPDFQSPFETANLAVLWNWPLLTPDAYRTVYVKFRDEAGNESNVVSDSITLDRADPSVDAFSVDGCNLISGWQYCSEPFLSLQIDGTDCNEVCLYTDGSCDTETWEPYAFYKNYTIQGGDSTYTLRTLCRDEAGNTSNAPSIAIVLDATHPDAPTVTTPSQKVNLASITVDRANNGDVDTYFLRWECKGGSGFTDWTQCSTTEGDLDFDFNLNADADNTLQVRSVDQALNTSDPGWVTIVEDSTAPDVPVITEVINRDHGVTLKWDPVVATDVKGYRIYYDYDYSGSDKAQYTGTFANEGDSPIDVGNLSTFTLTGLSNGIKFYVALDAYDDTTNPGSNASALTAAEEVRPNRVSPELESIYTMTQDGTGAMTVRNEYIFYADGATLQAYDASDPSGITTADGEAYTSGADEKIVQWGRQAYVFDSGVAGITPFRITPRNLSEYPAYQTDKRFYGFMPRDNTAYGVYWDTNGDVLGGAGYRVARFTLSDTAVQGEYDPVLYDSVTLGVPRDLWVQGNYYYVVGSNGVQRYRTSDNTEYLSEFGPHSGQRIQVHKDYMFIGTEDKLYAYSYSGGWIQRGGVFVGCRDFAVGGNLLYCASNDLYNGGLKVLDISDLTSIRLVGEYTGPRFWEVELSGGYVYARDTSDIYAFRVVSPERVEYSGGLIEETRSNNAMGPYVIAGSASNDTTRFRVVDVTDPYDIFVNTSYTNATAGSNLLEIGVDYEHVYFNQPSAEVWIVRWGGTGGTSFVGSLTSGDTPVGTHPMGNYLLVSRYNALESWDIHDRASPALSDTLDTPAMVNWSIYVTGGYAHVASGTHYYIAYVGYPPNLTETADVSIGTTVKSIWANGDYSYVCRNGSDGFRIYDISSITLPSLIDSVGSIDTEQCYGSGKYLFTGPTFRVWDLEDPTSPTMILEHDPLDFVQGVSQQGPNLYITGHGAGFQLWQLTR